MRDFIYGEEYGKSVRKLLSDDAGLTIAVSYWSAGILRFGEIDKLIRTAEHRSIRIICDLMHDACDCEPIEKLIQTRIEVRAIRGLHAKVWLSEKSAILGSANASLGALHLFDDPQRGNSEAGIRIADASTLRSIQQWFEELWNSNQCKDVTPYDIELKRRQARKSEFEETIEIYPGMAETQYLERSEILNAVDRWKTRCLISEKSLFTNDSLWSLSTFWDLRDRILNVTKNIVKFNEVINMTLNNAPADTCKLLAELYWLFCLIHQASAKSKIGYIKTIWSMSRAQPIPDDHELFELLRRESGFVHYGQALAQKPAAFRFLILLMCEIFAITGRDRETLIKRHDEIAGMCDDVYRVQESQARHIVLFLMFPKVFLPIINNDHKKAIATYRSFSRYFGGSDLPESPSPYEIDLRLNAIRYNLEKEEDASIDFYGDPRFNGWRN